MKNRTRSSSGSGSASGRAYFLLEAETLEAPEVEAELEALRVEAEVDAEMLIRLVLPHHC
jgi:hypothetical protein